MPATSYGVTEKELATLQETGAVKVRKNGRLGARWDQVGDATKLCAGGQSVDVWILRIGRRSFMPYQDGLLDLTFFRHPGSK